jgi:hypothetical protein
MKTYGGIGGTAPRILNLGTSWRWVVSSTPRPLYPRYPLCRRRVNPRAVVKAVVKRNSLPLPGIKTGRPIHCLVIILTELSSVHNLKLIQYQYPMEHVLAGATNMWYTCSTCAFPVSGDTCGTVQTPAICWCHTFVTTFLNLSNVCDSGTEFLDIPHKTPNGLRPAETTQNKGLVLVAQSIVLVAGHQGIPALAADYGASPFFFFLISAPAVWPVAALPTAVLQIVRVIPVMAVWGEGNGP